MPRKHQTWNANSDLVSDIILWEDYRNDPTLKQISVNAKLNRTVQDKFWISGNGGAASYAGELAQTGFASRDANSAAPAAKLPGGQRLSAGAATLHEVASRKGVIRVFVRDWETKHLPEIQSQVVYLRIFQIKRVTFDCDDEDTVIADATRLSLPISAQRFMQFRLEFHYKFYLEPLTPTNINLDTTWSRVESSPWDSRFITVPRTVTDTKSDRISTGMMSSVF
jgi:hypothetical protein